MTDAPTIFDATTGEVRPITQAEVDGLVAIAGAYSFLKNMVSQAGPLAEQFRQNCLSPPQQEHLEIPDDEMDKWCEKHGLEPWSQRHFSHSEREFMKFQSAVNVLREFGYEVAKCHQN